MDPQSNATSGLGVDSNEATLSSYNLIIGNAKASNIVIQTSSPNLDLIPAKIDLVGLEIEIVNESSREYLLKNALEKIRSLQKHSLSPLSLLSLPSLLPAVGSV